MSFHITLNICLLCFVLHLLLTQCRWHAISCIVHYYNFIEYFTFYPRIYIFFSLSCDEEYGWSFSPRWIYNHKVKISNSFAKTCEIKKQCYGLRELCINSKPLFLNFRNLLSKKEIEMAGRVVESNGTMQRYKFGVCYS